MSLTVEDYIKDIRRGTIISVDDVQYHVIYETRSWYMCFVVSGKRLQPYTTRFWKHWIDEPQLTIR